MNRARSILFIILLSLTFGSAQAIIGSFKLNAPAIRAVDVDSNIPAGRAAGEYDIALLIGNRNYPREGIPNVDYAHNDLKTMRNYLQKTMGFRADNIIVEKDLTKGSFETLFGTAANPRGKLQRYLMAGESKLFIYYVGHGAPDPESGDGFFVPVDADPDYIANSGYKLATFYANLKRLPAKQTIVVLDACFSGRTQKGLLFKNVSPALLKVNESQFGLSSGAVFSSARGSQLSTWYPKKRHSMFSYYFFKGMQGAADSNSDGKITSGEMQHYVAKNVRYMAGRVAGKDQEPQMEGEKGLGLAHLR